LSCAFILEADVKGNENYDKALDELMKRIKQRGQNQDRPDLVSYDTQYFNCHHQETVVDNIGCRYDSNCPTLLQVKIYAS
jgi:hypothetical protein